DGAEFMKHPDLVYLGKISYGLYAYHILALRLAYQLFSSYHHAFALTLSSLYALVLTFGMAVISFKWLEAPFLRWKQRRFTYIPFGPPVADLDRQASKNRLDNAKKRELGAVVPSTES